MLLKSIVDNYNKLSRTEKIIADYIIENPAIALEKNAYELAEITKTSPATVGRFSKKIGFSNFLDAKIHLIMSISTPLKDVTGGMSLFIDDGDSYSKCAKKLLGQISNVCNSVLEIIDYNQVEIAVKKMLKANVIMLAGIGASAISAQDLYIKLNNIAFKVQYDKDPHINIKSMFSATPKDVVVIFSYSGELKLITKAAQIASERGAFVISICGNINSSLSKYSDLLFQSPAMEQRVRVGAVSSHYSQQFISDLLFLGIISKSFNKTKEKIVETNKIMKEII